MKVTAKSYLWHFHSMILEGVACGLLTPKEWLRSYSRCIAESYENYPEIAGFIKVASRELFEVEFCRKPTMDEIDEWLSGDKVTLTGGDSIEIDRTVNHLYHKCCSCGQNHFVEVQWKDGSIMLKWYRHDEPKGV